MKRQSLRWAVLCSSIVPATALADLSELVLTVHESPTFDGVAFGAAGQYERLTGYAVGTLDPANPLNSGIINLDRAPRNADGLVEYRVDVDIIKPVDLGRGNGALFYDVVNRGNKRALARVNSGPGGNNPTAAADAGNGFLMSEGYTIVWSGWQGDVAPGGGRLTADFPIATNNGDPIVGQSREEFIVESGADPIIGNLTYPATDLDPSQANLTVRQNETDQRQMPPGLSFTYLSDTQISITRPTGDDFDAGAIYEFVYSAKDPTVMGIGFAATRDVVSFLMNEVEDDLGNPNPLLVGIEPGMDRALALGISQSGRFLRDLVYQGFNEDEAGRRVFDGVIPVIAGSRKTFTNYEFAQPGRYSRQHEDHLFPGDQFPFTYTELADPISGKTESILTACNQSGTCPKVMHFDSDTEIWQARGSLVVTDTSGGDVALPENVRAYLITGTQHGPAATPSAGICQQLSNPLNYEPVLRAVVRALDEWIADGTMPPESRYGSVGDGTLVLSDQGSTGFPSIPGVTYNGLVNGLRLNDHSVQPPEEGAAYPVFVSKMDADGNGLAGVRVPNLEAPLATHGGWNLRAEGHAPDELCSTTGSFIPFAETKDERLASGDPRLSLEERYRNHGAYVSTVAKAAARLVQDRLLLQEDADRIVGAAGESGIGKP